MEVPTVIWSSLTIEAAGILKLQFSFTLTSKLSYREAGLVEDTGQMEKLLCPDHCSQLTFGQGIRLTSNVAFIMERSQSLREGGNKRMKSR